jgi:hypothetical protein
VQKVIRRQAKRSLSVSEYNKSFRIIAVHIVARCFTNDQHDRDFFSIRVSRVLIFNKQLYLFTYLVIFSKKYGYSLNGSLICVTIKQFAIKSRDLWDLYEFRLYWHSFCKNKK